MGTHCGDTLWEHTVVTHCGNTLWEQSVRTNCGNTLWEQSVRTNCGNTLWEHTVGTHCENTLWEHTEWTYWKHTMGTYCGNTLCEHTVKTPCGNTLWKFTVGTHCRNSLLSYMILFMNVISWLSTVIFAWRTRDKLPWWHRRALTQWPPFLNVTVLIRSQVYACWKWPSFHRHLKYSPQFFGIRVFW